MPLKDAPTNRELRLETLRKVRRLLETESHWTKGEDARDRHGEGCDVRSSAAVCYCLGGAIYSCLPGDAFDIDAYLDVFRNAGVFPDDAVAFYPWNDSPARTHAEVLEAIDKGIAYLEGVTA